MKDDEDEDIRMIRAIAARQFRSMSWREGEKPDSAAFMADFVPNAPLYASARPVQPQSIQQFAERMERLAGTSLRSFEETVLGSMVRVYGNIAVAVVACEAIENGAETNRNVEMLLLVKNQGVWRIAAQAWDKESADNPVTSELGGR